MYVCVGVTISFTIPVTGSESFVAPVVPSAATLKLLSLAHRVVPRQPPCCCEQHAMQKWFRTHCSGGGDGGGGGGGGRGPPLAVTNSGKGRASLKDTQAALASALKTLKLREDAIKQLEEELVKKDSIIADLNTQLDKLRSVLPPPTGSLHGRPSLRSFKQHQRNNNSEHHNRNSLQNDRLYPPNANATRPCSSSATRANLLDGTNTVVVESMAESSRVKRTAISAEPAAQDLNEFYDPDYAPVVVPKSQQ